mgnify:CR=1 FL=1
MKNQNFYLKKDDLVDSAKNPNNYGLLQKYDFICSKQNISCGDSVVICGVIKDGVLQDVRFEGRGCMLNIAMASKLTDFVKGKSIEDILLLNDEIIQKLLGLQLGMNRMQCAMLSVIALVEGISDFKNKN